MGIIIFNGKSSKEDYNIEVEHPPKYDFPEEDVEVVHVPGRNGDIIIRKGSYKNVKAEYELSSGDGETAQAILARAITTWLHNGRNYCRLEDTYDPDIYRMAAYKEAGSIENIYDLGARVTVNFDCKPQRWLKSGEEPISTNKPFILPEGYTQVEYIEGDGTAYIDTGITLSKDFRIAADIAPLQHSSSEQALISNYDASESTIKWFNFILRNTDRLDMYVNGWKFPVYDKVEFGKKTHVSIKRSTSDWFVSIDDEDTWFNYARNVDSTNTLKFLKNGANTGSATKARIWYAEVETPTDKYQFVPCYRNSDDEIGLYDIVNDTFYMNAAASGSFIKSENNLLTLINPTDQNASPLIKVTSYGNSHMNINGYQLDFKGLEISTTSSDISNLTIDIAKFMEEYPTEDPAVAFSVKDFGLTAEVYEEDTGITDVTLNESIFRSKVTIGEEAIYIVIFTDAGIQASNISANTIDSVTITNAGYFENYDPGTYTLVYTGNDNSFLTSSNQSLTLSVNTVTYRNRFADKPWEAYTSHVYTYSSANEGWMDDEGYLVLLSDYGITVTGTPANNDTITGGIFPTFSVEGKSNIETKIFDIVGYPLTGDSIDITKVVAKWSIYKNEDLLEDNVDISEYGISVTGEPADGDSIVITAKGVWKDTSQTIVDMSEVGISYSGFAKLNDEIDILIGRPIIIDCEAKDCYSEGSVRSNRNDDVSMPDGYPELSPGNNTITYTEQIRSVEVTPRWWTL